MSGSFLLTLDTHAPQLTWGATSGTTAGELLHLEYMLDEPGVQSATITLGDGRELALTDTGSVLEALLPADTPNGAGTVRVVVRDEVWNTHTYTRVLLLAGVVVEPTPAPDQTPAPAGGLPRREPRRRQPEARTVTTRARLTARGRASAVAHPPVPSSVIRIPSSGSRIFGSRSTRVDLHAGARSRLAARLPVSRDSTRRLGTRASVIRRDGPSPEDLLLLELL